MTMEYKEEEYLQLSGIQHFEFCRRQWALIHIEQQWQENIKTTLGNIAHENCHNDTMKEKRKDLIITRGLRVSSRTLGVAGQCDVVEFWSDPDGVMLSGREGRWKPHPVEYKLGKSKTIDADRFRLCCQAMCLEEMLCCDIAEADIFYHETHRREKVALTDELRNKVKSMLREMHSYYSKGYTPLTKPKSGCKSCSLIEICHPQLCKVMPVASYYKAFMNG